MIVVEGPRSFLIGSPARLMVDNAELAWAEPLVRHDPHLRWITGRYVEADSVNKNGHIFPLEDLKAKVPTIAHKPMNMLHHPNRIVGHYAGAELLYPATATGAAAVGQRPFVETLSAFYAWYFPEQLAELEKAHADGVLAQSMECTPDQLNCVTCEQTFEYAGRQSPTYCTCLQKAGSAKRLLGGGFSGGGLIVPPSMPAWSNADITNLMAWMEEHVAEQEAADTYEQVADDFSHLGPKQWEQMMATLLRQEAEASAAEYAKKFGVADRMRLAKMDPPQALPDGSYPIETTGDLRNAIRLAQSGHGDVAEAKKLIRRMATKLGAETLVPDGF